MLESVIVLLDKNSSSFCYYKNKDYNNQESEFMPIVDLKKIIKYAKDKKIAINYIYGNKKLPNNYKKIIKSYPHTKLISLKLSDNLKDNNENIIVVNQDDLKLTEKIKRNNRLNLILRLEKKELKKLSIILNKLIGRFKRLNLILLDLNTYNLKDIDEYSKQLKLIENIIEGEYRKEHDFELNFLTDRMLLKAMNNCNAGIKHITFAPDGKFYLCPAFYYDKIMSKIGDLDNGIKIENEQLLQLQNAPICRHCDSFHCKRCYYLNMKTTLEINIPSHQQCVISHLERNSSKDLLQSLKKNNIYVNNAVSIPDIDYLDPIKLAKEKNERMFIDDKNNFSISSEISSLPDRDLLLKIYEMQNIILDKLNKN